MSDHRKRKRIRGLSKALKEYDDCGEDLQSETSYGQYLTKVRLGVTPRVAASVLGIVSQTWSNWYERGMKEEEGDYKRFYLDSLHAMCDAYADREQVVAVRTPQVWLEKSPAARMVGNEEWQDDNKLTLHHHEHNHRLDVNTMSFKEALLALQDSGIDLSQQISFDPNNIIDVDIVDDNNVAHDNNMSHLPKGMLSDNTMSSPPGDNIMSRLLGDNSMSPPLDDNNVSLPLNDKSMSLDVTTACHDNDMSQGGPHEDSPYLNQKKKEPMLQPKEKLQSFAQVDPTPLKLQSIPYGQTQRDDVQSVPDGTVSISDKLRMLKEKVS